MFRVTLSVCLFALVARADDSLLHARRARTLLEPGTWSRILRIENSEPHADYPREFHALIFEFADVLWLYCDFNGTQSFSLHRNRLAEEKADFGPLLREIARGLHRWTVVADAEAAPGPVPNGCFLESLAAWRARQHAREPIEDARLLSYYVCTASGMRGHTVLVYRANGRAVLFDPAQPKAQRSFPVAAAEDPLNLARKHEGRAISTARFLPIPVAEQIS